MDPAAPVALPPPALAVDHLNPPSPAPAVSINPLLLASACSGNRGRLNILLNSQLHATAEDEELQFGDLIQAYTASGIAPASILEGVTVHGDTALHAVATNGDGDNFLWCANLICIRAQHDILFVKNKRGDTALHLAARAGNHKMVSRLMDIAKGFMGGVSHPTIGAARVKILLETKNKLEETALHDAIRVGSDDMVMLLMEEDPELARIPDKGTSPLYLAILLEKKIIAETLYEKSGGVLSYSGPTGQNALHAAVGRGPDLTKMMLEWHKDLITQMDENGNTPLHFAAEQLGRESRSVCQQLVEANPAMLYQSDQDGFFPIHVAASVGAWNKVAMFVERQPSTAGLRDAKGRTFLHVAVEKDILKVAGFASGYKPISWILNMRDNNGNTALHLAVQKGSLTMVSSLLMNLQVEVDLTNDKGKTPLDISQDKIPASKFFYSQNSEALIHHLLTLVRARRGASRQNPFNNENTDEDDKESKMIKDTTDCTITGSVLIATVTFGAIFALPGGYIADDHKNGGTPTRAGRYAFDAFMIANTLSFFCSSIATMGFMHSGSSMINLVTRRFYLSISTYLMQTSISGLAAAFALAVYIVLAPIAHRTTTAVCVLTSLVVLSSHMEFWAKKLCILPTLVARKGLTWTIGFVALLIIGQAVILFWPIIFIFGWAARPGAHR